MDKFAIDYSNLQTSLNKRKAYKLEDVKDKIQKIAFDVVRFQDPKENIDGLWQVQSCADGDYIVALYDEDAVKVASSNWSIICDKSQKNINFFYKGSPIVRLASSKLGAPEEEISSIISYLPEKLANNPGLVKGLLLEASSEERNQILTQYPELNQ